MKKIYFTLFFTLSLCILTAQTTINYPQQVANYTTFSDGAGAFDDGTTQLGMWANGGSIKQVAAWRNFTEDGTTGGTPSTMAVGDSFTITLNATRAYGQIGIALLSSPSGTASWNDRINNYAVQVNLNGNGGAFDPWEIISTGGTATSSAINGSTTDADFVFKFTLNSATTMTVDLNNGAETFNITVNNQNITGYSIYFADDWNGSENKNIFWKQTSEYKYAVPLSNEEFTKAIPLSINLIENMILLDGINYNEKYTLKVYDLGGKLVKQMDETSDLNLNSLTSSVYILKLKTENNIEINKKVIKK